MFIIYNFLGFALFPLEVSETFKITWVKIFWWLYSMLFLYHLLTDIWLLFTLWNIQLLLQKLFPEKSCWTIQQYCFILVFMFLCNICSFLKSNCSQLERKMSGWFTVPWQACSNCIKHFALFSFVVWLVVYGVFFYFFLSINSSDKLKRHIPYFFVLLQKSKQKIEKVKCTSERETEEEK